MTIGFDLNSARQFVARADLGPVPLGLTSETPDLVFDKAKQEAVVVGSQVLSFDTGVEATFREAVSDSALLAQLAANRITDAGKDPIAWFDAYFAVLGNIGWAIQARDTATYEIKNDGMEVHQAILDVISAFIGSAPGAAALVKLTLESLKSMDADSPLITLFDRESQHADIGRFQFTTVRQDPDGGLFAEAMAFALHAEKTITQILFFKLKKGKSTLRRSLGTISLNRDALTALKPAIRAKVQAHMAGFVAALDIGPA